MCYIPYSAPIDIASLYLCNFYHTNNKNNYNIVQLKSVILMDLSLVVTFTESSFVIQLVAEDWKPSWSVVCSLRYKSIPTLSIEIERSLIAILD